MNKLRKSPSIRLKIPNQKPLFSILPKKQRLISQQTIDTNTNNKQSQIQTLAKINQEQIMFEIKESLKIIEGYKSSFLKQRDPLTLRDQLRMKQIKIQERSKQIRLLNQEIGRLKEVYGRPKPKKTPANIYSQQHLKIFTLAGQLQKQKKHLQLHIQHHRNLKQKAKDLHNNIKSVLPQYYDMQKRRGFHPISYGQFRMKVIIKKKQQQAKQRIKSSLSSRSISGRSRLSVKSIVEGQSSIITSSSQKNLWQMQRRRSIINRAMSSSQKKHNTEIKNASDQLQFLRKEDNNLTQKINLLTQQVNKLISLNNSFQFTFVSKQLNQFSKVNQ